MTSKKNIIVIAIIALIVIAVVAIAIRSFSVSSDSDLSPASNAANAILPHGSQLDFSQINKYNSDSKLFNYPEVATDNIGVNLPEILNVQAP